MRVTPVILPGGFGRRLYARQRFNPTVAYIGDETEREAWDRLWRDQELIDEFEAYVAELEPERQQIERQTLAQFGHPQDGATDGWGLIDLHTSLAPPPHVKVLEPIKEFVVNQFTRRTDKYLKQFTTLNEFKATVKVPIISGHAGPTNASGPASLVRQLNISFDDTSLHKRDEVLLGNRWGSKFIWVPEIREIVPARVTLTQSIRLRPVFGVPFWVNYILSLLGAVCTDGKGWIGHGEPYRDMADLFPPGLEIGWYSFASDYSRYDSSIPAWLLEFAIDVMLKVWHSTKIQTDYSLGMEAAIRKSLFAKVLAPAITGLGTPGMLIERDSEGGYLYSGSKLTAIIGSIVNFVIQVLSWSAGFDRDVYWVIRQYELGRIKFKGFSDDSMCRIAPELIPLFDMGAYLAVPNAIGVTMGLEPLTWLQFMVRNNELQPKMSRRIVNSIFPEKGRHDLRRRGLGMLSRWWDVPMETLPKWRKALYDLVGVGQYFGKEVEGMRWFQLHLPQQDVALIHRMRQRGIDTKDIEHRSFMSILELETRYKTWKQGGSFMGKTREKMMNVQPIQRVARFYNDKAVTLVFNEMEKVKNV